MCIYIYISMQSKKNVGVYLGRFQPLHIAHLNIILQGLKTEDHFIVILGSAGKHDDKNPFSPAIREKFVIDSVKEYDEKLLTKLSVVKLYAAEVPEKWYSAINNLVIDAINKTFNNNINENIINEQYNLFLYGSGKDASTIKCSSGVKKNTIIKIDKFIEPISHNGNMLNSTDIRNKLNKYSLNELKSSMPNAVFNIISCLF